MSYIVLARKWRPRTFEQMVGQPHLVRTLKNAIAANRISHAYLFTGPRGVGKTTTARLLAKAVNCLSPQEGEPCNHCVRCEDIMSGAATDVIEIDAASNGLVDDARDLREKVRYTPVACRYKVIIIDEVHMMSNSAFNALLKTLEEPPAHTIFILATTEVHKVPATIISRCQRFDFRRIQVREIVERLALMASSENITVAEEALQSIARGADGSLRDAQSLFDQVISFTGGAITSRDVATVLGLADYQVFVMLIDAVADHRAPDALAAIEELVNQGSDLRLFMRDWVEYWRTLVLTRFGGNKPEAMDLGHPQERETMRQAERFSPEELLYLARSAAMLDDDLRRTQHPRMLLELFLLRLCAVNRYVSLEAMWRELQNVEARLAKMPEKSLPLCGPETPAVAQSEEGGAPAAPAVVEGEDALAIESLEDAAPMSYLDKVKESWPAVIQTMGQKNRRVQALLRDVEVTAGEEGWIELTCNSSYHFAGLEKEESRKLIRAVLEAELGRPTRVQLKSSAPEKGDDAGKTPDKNGSPKDFEEIARREPLVSKTLELFGGKIVDVIHKPGGGGKNK